MSADRVDVLGNLRMALQHVVLCAPDEVVQKQIEETIDAVNELIETSSAYAEAEEELANRELHGINAEPYDRLLARVHAARRDLDSALSRVAQPGAGDE